MTLRGVIENGRLLLEGGANLPDGTLVSVAIRREGGRSRRAPSAKADPLARLAQHAVSTGIRDLADEHDHYAYGSPKRGTKPVKPRRKSKRPSGAGRRGK